MKEKSFAKELAELINRHSIDAQFEMADDILATVAIDALNAYAKAKQTQERRNNPDADTCDCPACQMRRALEAKKAARPEPGKKEYRKPEAFDVPKEVTDVLEFARTFFPGAKIELHRIDVPGIIPGTKGGKETNAKEGEKMSKFIDVGGIRIKPENISSYAQTYDNDNNPEITIVCDGKIWVIPEDVLDETEQYETLKKLDEMFL